MDDTPKRLGRPKTPTGTPPVRTARVGAIWDEAHAVAQQRQESLGQVITRALENYVRRHRKASG